MRIGYPCINRSIGCSPAKTFRLRSYSDSRLEETVRHNLECLAKILAYNADHGLLFFRITSDLVPFASHPVCTFPWQERFSDQLACLGEFIHQKNMRISLHPDQFTLINSPDEEVFARSVEELVYHCTILELMGLGDSSKIQIHVGGKYHDRIKSLERFVKRYETLNESIRSHLVVENDDRLFSVSDCLLIHEGTGIPVLLDTFHHGILNRGESMETALGSIASTWSARDGIPMVDYSTQQPGRRSGVHAETIDEHHFTRFLSATYPRDIDIMLEIRDKEKSALRAVGWAHSDSRFINRHRRRINRSLLL
jgi:UV DNA damage endonuclease